MKKDAIDGAVAALEKPEKKNGKYKPTKEQEQAVLEFAILNKCVVTPLGWHSALEAYNEYGHCVCDPARPTCPCEQAPQEIKAKGHCKCCLFWKGYDTYIKSRNLATCSKGGDHEWGTDGKYCDLDKIKSEASKKREERIRELRAAGVPITRDILSGVGKQAYKEATEQCKPVDVKLTPEQAELLKQYYPEGVRKK